MPPFALSEMREVGGFYFVVFRTDEEGSYPLRGPRWEAWKAPTQVCLEPMQRNHFRRAVGDV